jgi:ketosteroid isomerase-like protein
MTTNRLSDEEQIRELVECWAEAAREKDIDGALANHTQ